MSNNSFDDFSGHTLYCDRCRLKPAIYSCERCHPSGNFCIQCDNFVHCMSSTQSHNREVIQTSSHQKSQSRSKVNDLTFSAGRYENTRHTQNRSEYRMSPSHYKTEQTQDKPYNSSVSQSLQRTSNDYDSIKNRNHSVAENSSYATGTRDYVQDLKNIYEREKQDLLFRNSTLQSSLDHTKVSLNEKVYNLEFKLEETVKKNELNRQIMEDEFNLRLKRALNDKDLEIKNYIYRLEECERSNNELLAKLNESLKETADLKNYYKNMTNDMEYEYKVKDREYIELKQSFENKIKYYTTSFEEEKLKIIKGYEDNIEAIVRSHRETKDKLNGIIYKKEVDLKNVMDRNREEEMRYLSMINELKKEVSARTTENNGLKTKVTQFENEVEILQRTIDKSKKESSQMENNLKSLENQHKKQTEEHKELNKVKDTLHGLVYGKNLNPKKKDQLGETQSMPKNGKKK